MSGFPINLLSEYQTDTKSSNRDYAKEKANLLSENLDAFKVGATITQVRNTPFAVLCDLVPDEGVSVKKIKDLRVDLEVRLGLPVEIVSLGEQRFTVKIALKEWSRPVIGLRKVLESEDFMTNEYKLPIAAGMDVMGNPFVFDLAETPHLLVAGCTGAGKSTFLNDLILSLIYSRSPKEVKFLMIDPKGVELVPYNGIPHMQKSVVTDVKDAIELLQTISTVSRERFDLFGEENARDIDAYNAKMPEGEKIPRVVIIVDEFMDMMKASPKEVEGVIKALASSGRATGIHLVLSTQRPSSDVVTSSIKGNIPCRASFVVVDKRESKIIIDRTGAERLLGNGDMLYSATESSKPIHAQASYVSYEDVDKVLRHLRKNRNRVTS